MTAHILRGRVVAQPFVDHARSVLAGAGFVPVVDLIVVEHDAPLLGTNYRLHASFLRDVGFEVREHRLPGTAAEDDVVALIEQLNDDASCDVVQILIPLPPHVRVDRVVGAIDPVKEVEGLHPEHASRMLPLGTAPQSRPMMVPTALRAMVEHTGIDLSSASVVEVVDLALIRNNAIANLVARYGVMGVWPPEAALTIVDRTHPQLADFCRGADLVAVSITEPDVIRGEWIKPGAVVLDFNAIPVGTRTTADGREVPVLRGGVRSEEVEPVASQLCRVPGGFGPVMLGVLAANAADAAVARRAALVGGGVR